MAGSVNKAVIVGRLGRDPEVRTLQDGNRVISFSVATSDTWRDKQTQERRERTEWHRVAIFNEPLGRVAEQYLRKGSQVYLEGQLQTRKWTDQQGQERYTTEIVLQRFRGELQLLGSRGDSDGGYDEGTRGGERASAPGRGPAAGGQNGGRPNAYPASGVTSGGGAGPAGSYGEEPGPVGGPDDMDDEIPF